jgi:GT2 family glycosyltransferase
MRFSIVIPSVEATHSAFDSCLPTFFQHHGTDHEVILVDDGSDAETRAQIARQCERVGIEFLWNERNRGFARTANRGIRAATGDAVVLVNSDVRFTGPVLNAMARAFARSERIGVVGGLLLYPDGTVQHGGIARSGRYFVHRGYRETVGAAVDAHTSGYVLGCTGALLGLRRKTIDEIGLLDDGLVLAHGDVEYCLRAWMRGWRVYYSSEVLAVHEEGGTRGATLREKLERSPRWALRELGGARAFRRKLRSTDLGEIEARVARAAAGAV